VGRIGRRTPGDLAGRFPVVFDVDHLTQLDATTLAPKVDPRIRLRERLDSLHVGVDLGTAYVVVAVVDVGGGTTGIAVLRDGQVVAVADEPTGGTHVSLVLTGGLGISLEEDEQLKTDPDRQAALFPRVRPVFERIATIVSDHLAGHEVDHLHLVGGTAAFPGMPEVVAALTGLPVTSPVHPLLVTPLGVALHDPGPLAATDPATLDIHDG